MLKNLTNQKKTLRVSISTDFSPKIVRLLVPHIFAKTATRLFWPERVILLQSELFCHFYRLS